MGQARKDRHHAKHTDTDGTSHEDAGIESRIIRAHVIDHNELADTDLIAQADLVRDGSVTPLELVDAAIARIERVNPDLNAVVMLAFDQARAAAQRRLPDGPFKGVPYLLKDLIPTCEGLPQTSGSVVLKDVVADRDSELVKRLKRAGLIILGKTNTPEFGCNVTTEPRLFGPTRNPWNPDYSTGGSSGGSAAAVAARLVPAAHANDGGGSIRIPASCCGLFGLKPTRGRIPLDPNVGSLASGTVVEHAITRSVRDSAALLDATAGPALGDPYFAPSPARPFLQEVGANPGTLRIAVSTEPPFGANPHPDCVRAVQEAAQLCTDLGHTVTETAPRIDGEAFLTAIDVSASTSTTRTIEALSQTTGRTFTGADFDPLTLVIHELGRRHSAADYLNAVTELQSLGRVMADFLSDHDLWLTPTLREPPVLLGTFDRQANESPEEWNRRVWSYIPFTPISNATGQPAMTVPLYWNETGLPVGTHFLGRFGDEATLFRLASQLEQARPWKDLKPEISA